MTDRKANILARASRAPKVSDKIRLMILANEVKTIKDDPVKHPPGEPRGTAGE